MSMKTTMKMCQCISSCRCTRNDAGTRTQDLPLEWLHQRSAVAMKPGHRALRRWISPERQYDDRTPRSTDHSLTIIRPVPRPWSPSIPRAHNEMAGRNPMKPPAAGQSSRTRLSTKPIPNYITYPTPLSHSLSPRRAMYPPSRANRDLNFPNLAHRSSSSAERSDALPSVERAPSRGPRPGSGWGRIAGSRNGTPVWSSTDD
jgi:hypothetical protein